MNINIQTVHFDADQKLLSFVQKKLNKLETFHDKITKVEVYLKIENRTHEIKDKIAEIKIFIPKHECFVKATSKTFQNSFDKAFHAITHQLLKKKEKIAA